MKSSKEIQRMVSEQGYEERARVPEVKKRVGEREREQERESAKDTSPNMNRGSRKVHNGSK